MNIEQDHHFKAWFYEHIYAFSATPCNTDSVTPKHNWEVRHNHNLLLLAATQISLGEFTPPVWTELLLLKRPEYLSSHQWLHRIGPCTDGGARTACRPHGGAPQLSPPSPSWFGYLMRQGVQSGTPLPLQQSRPAVERQIRTIEQNKLDWKKRNHYFQDTNITKCHSKFTAWIFTKTWQQIHDHSHSYRLSQMLPWLMLPQNELQSRQLKLRYSKAEVNQRPSPGSWCWWVRKLTAGEEEIS